MAFGGIIQAVIAIALIIILAVVAFMVYNQEMITAVRESGKVRKSVPIFEGIKDLSVSKNEAYDTLNPVHPYYKPIENSLNQPAGAEYTYNFWLYLGDNIREALGSKSRDSVYRADTGLIQGGSTIEVLDEYDKPLVLFLRGNKTAYAYKGLCYKEGNEGSTKVDVLVKQPIVKLEQGGDVLSVELNTITAPDGVKEQSRERCGDLLADWGRMNSYRLAIQGLSRNNLQKWNMITLIVQDTYPDDPLPMRNKVRVRIFVNGVLELDRYVDGKMDDQSGPATVLRNNSSPLHIAPVIRFDGKSKGGSDIKYALTKELQANNDNAMAVMMANLTYFNYAIDDIEIKELLAKKFKKAFAPSAELGDNVDKEAFMKQIGYTSGKPVMSELGGK